MSLTFGGIAIPISESATTTDTLGNIAICGASIVNGEKLPNVVAKAKAGVLAGLDDFNLRGLFHYRRVVATDIVLVDDQTNYSVPSDFYALHEVQLIKDNKIVDMLTYMDTQEFNHTYQSQGLEGIPTIWHAASPFDSGVDVYPIPKEATDYSLRINYYKRIDKPSTDDDIIIAPVELTSLLCWYSKEYVLMHLNAKDRGLRLDCQQKWKEMVDAFKGRNKQTPGNRRMRVNK